MQLLLYVALLYILPLYKVWKSQPRRPGRMGKRTLKRLRVCAPQCLERQRRLMITVVVATAVVRDVLQYGFCYYYGIHAVHWSTWCLAAAAIQLKHNDWHASTPAQCYLLSFVTLVSMGRGHSFGPMLGAVVTCLGPLFLCPPRLCVDSRILQLASPLCGQRQQ